MANRPNTNPGGQQQLSPVIKWVRDLNDGDLAAWQASCAVTEDSFKNLAFKRRDEVSALIKSDGKGFLLAARKLIQMVEADPESGFSAVELGPLQTDVFDKTAVAIAKAEKERAEAAKAQAEADKAKKKKEAAKETSGEVHNFADFLARTLGSAARAQRQARFIAFSQLLTPAQKQNFATGIKEGDQAPKFEALTQCAAASDAVALAEVNGWI